MPDVREIYNYYVRNSVVTFDEKPWTHTQWREKFEYLHRLGLPFLVAVAPTGQVLGYALASPWSGKSSFRYTAENSIYLGPGAAGKGLGGALLGAHIDACEEFGLHEIVAVISDRSADASIALHEKFGFREVGRMGRVGFKFGRWLGTIYLQKSLKGRRRPDLCHGCSGEQAQGNAPLSAAAERRCAGRSAPARRAGSAGTTAERPA